jgi:NADH:ubiquinone oxidoreductase subunit 5 (subunit L)/multisubunit Na+/H+ antiporter MnhA subunit
MFCFLFGSAAICALPPLNGFASKWILYQSVLQTVWLSDSVIDRALSLGVVCLLGIVGGLSLACFTKAVGITFLGNFRSQAAAHAHEASTGMIAAQLFLAAGCLTLGLIIPKALSVLRPVTDLAMHATTNVNHAFVIPQLAIALSLFGLVFAIWAIFLQSSRVRRFITWECGFGDLTSRTQVSSDSFAQPVATIFGPILRYKVDFDIKGKDRRHFPEYIKVKAHMKALLEQRIYGPALEAVDLLSRALAKFQAGSIHLYLVYLCCTLVVLLLLGTRL